ncbi:MAG: hypothetical protein WCG29_10255 [Desulfomonile sp.]|jgi:hypothetical protein|nr:hypothetical protein [Deltaproteobacteria bacterium]
MEKPEMVCPFSKKLCIECAQFRGRHYYFCFAPRYRGSSCGDNEAAPFKPRNVSRDTGIQEPPVISMSSKWLTNLEDCL